MMSCAGSFMEIVSPIRRTCSSLSQQLTSFYEAHSYRIDFPLRHVGEVETILLATVFETVFAALKAASDSGKSSLIRLLRDEPFGVLRQ